MALNCSHRPVSPAHMTEDNLVSPVRIVNGYLVEGVSEKNGEVYSRPWHVNLLEANDRRFSCGRDIIDCCSSPEPTSNDIVDLLPSDPFEMDIETTFTAISGWIRDMRADDGGYMRSNNGASCQENYDLFAGLNLMWNNTCMFKPFPCTIQLNERLNTGMQSFPSNHQVVEKPNTCSDYYPGTCMGTRLAPSDVGSLPDCNLGNVSFSDGSASCSLNMKSTGEEEGEMEVEGASEFEGVPHEVFNYVLSYLGIKDLLSVERVCSSLSSAVRGDPLLWKTIHIDMPLNERITDDVLVQLASRAEGKLQCLSLVECPKVTDDGIMRVLEANRRLTKLCVPGCTKISVDGTVKSIRAFNCNNEFGGIKHVRIASLFDLNQNNFEELSSLLGLGNKKIESHQNPHFYNRCNVYLPYDDDRAMDIEMCPRCDTLKLVYDCPSAGCDVKDGSREVCRACTYCIGRCADCGRCINNTKFEETFELDMVCSDCYEYQNKLDNKSDPVELNVV